MGLSQSNHRLLGGAKSSLSTTFTPCLIGGARRPLTKEQRKEYNRRRQERRARMRDQAEVEDQPSTFELDDFIITESEFRILDE